MIFRIAAASPIVGVVLSVVPPPNLPSYYPTDDARSFMTFQREWSITGKRKVCRIDACKRAQQSPKTTLYNPVPCGKCLPNYRGCAYGSNWYVTFCSEDGTMIYQQEYEDEECTRLCTPPSGCTGAAIVHACGGSERHLKVEQGDCEKQDCFNGERASETCCQDCGVPDDPCFNSWTNEGTSLWEEIVENGGELV